ncbi:MAG: STAS domain-containing protein, partial [Actinomycetota bacterium]|nr:STAS domain-containing protein [Actinomycetota bacterium]
FSMSTSFDGSVFVVELFGELDALRAPEVEAVMRRAEGSPADLILVDLSALHFIDFSGIQVLMNAAKRSQAGGRMRFLRGVGQVERVLKICGLEIYFEFLD